MSQSSWIISQPDPYQVPKLLIDQEIQKVIQSIRKSGQKQVEIQFKFKRQADLQKFMKIYQQQMFQEQYDYLDNQKINQENKFKKCKDIDQKNYEVRQLAFPSFHFVNIFMKIYETRLTQLQIEYQYKFLIYRNKFRVLFPKRSKISSFFKNQIFQMKTKLNLFYSNDQTVIDKVKYSAYFNSLIEKQSIAAQYHKRLNKVDVAIFYSNIHQKKKIIEIVNKNFFQHMTILDFMDKNLKSQNNQVIFKLLYSLLLDKIKRIQKENDIIIQANNEKCCILIHDKHQCFDDAKNQIMGAIEKTIAFRLDGNDMRTLFNKVIRNHQKYPYLRVKYSHRSLYCVVDCVMLVSNRKNVTSFLQFLVVYFQSFTHKNHITLFPKLSKYCDFLYLYFKVSEDKNLTILNFNEFTMNNGYQISKIILGVKDIGQLNVIKTRNDFLQVFLQLILKTQKVNHILQSVYIKFDNNEGLLGFQDHSQYSTLLSQSLSQTDKSQIQSNFSKQNQKVSQQKVYQKVNDSQKQKLNAQNVPQLVNRTSSSYRYKQRQKKPKHIDITYDYKEPQIDLQQHSFWNHSTRERKLQKLLCQKYDQYFRKLNFKIYKLALKQKIDLPSKQEFEKDKIYISTIVEKNNQICHHLIDLNEFSKLCSEVKDRTFFIFYKLASQQVYLPSFTLALI